MQVCVDGSVFENNHQVGIWRYLYEVLGRVGQQAEVSLWLGGAAKQPLPANVKLCRDSSRIVTGRWNLAARGRRRAAKRFPPRELAAAAVYHTAYFTPCPVRKPTRVVTVLDMIAERLFPICSGWAVDNIAKKRAALADADLCLCISNATASDLRAFYPELADRVRVIPLGVDHLTGPHEQLRSGDAGRPFGLFVGHRDNYKNFWVIPHAMQHPSWPRDLQLHVVGDPPEDHDLSLLKAMGVADRVHFLGRIPDAVLKQQYRAARCFIFPSLLEGFGLPILEAQTNGCAVVCSDIAAFHEVAGEGAIFFDPRVAEQLAEAVAAVMEPDIRRQLCAAGEGNVRRFSWDRAAQETLSAYEEAASMSRR